MRIAIYGRVSKNDDSQHLENQLRQLRDYAKALQGDIVAEYTDCASGGGNSDRVNFLQMLADSDKHKFDLVLVWALDRMSREGIRNTLGYLERFKRSGVAVKSLQEAWLDTRDDGIGQLLLAIFSWVAAQERSRIQERVKAGLDRAKSEGKTLGRPMGKKDTKKRKKGGYFLRYQKK